MAASIYGRLLDGLAALACLLLFALMVLVCADVFLRNVGWFPSMRGVDGANDLSEWALYLITMLSAPWLLRRGQHIRVDILLRALPPRIAWGCEWLVDLIALACCVVMTWYGFKAMLDSQASGAMAIKAFVTPEWWSFVPLPITFALVGIEVLFRMQRLAAGERGPRDDAVSAS